VVTFDPDLDFAVLRTTGLAGKPLPLDHSTAPRGTVGAALGYPGGREFTASPAAIVQSQTAIGRDIYDTGLVKRQVYTIQADLHPGNSGGPLITPDGVVVGIVFARSVSHNGVGYALTSPEVLPQLSAAAQGPVTTGKRCVIG
jgi:S1-C subfamily serine protease